MENRARWTRWAVVAVGWFASAGGMPANATSDTAGAASSDQGLRCERLPFVENVFWTTQYGPAPADVVTGSASMLRCDSGAYALCYYSGAEPMPCVVDEEKGVASCECLKLEPDVEHPEYIVVINSILNTCVYVESVAQCGHSGENCAGTVGEAEVCDYVEQNELIPGADLISTFSFAPVGDFELGCTECEGTYAGCMTAPCYERMNDEGESVVVCDCPLYDGPYQFGRRGDYTCDAGDGLVWSAAYNPEGCPSDGGSALPWPAGE